MFRPGVLLILVLALMLLCGSVVRAADPPDPQFKNLQVLPDTLSHAQLDEIMGSFTRALGVRCSYCHIGGGNNQQRTPEEFASDEKPTKQTARAMLRMVQAINQDHLGKLEHREDPTIHVQCSTCHRGVTEPRPLQDVLRLAYSAGGIDSTLSAYDGLRERYDGRAAYDFGEVALVDVANTVEYVHGNLRDAARLAARNLEEHPDSRFAMRHHARTAIELAFVEAGADSGTACYRALSASDAPRPEEVLNEVGYALLQAGKTKEAIAALTLNVEAFPQSGNVYDSLAEAYATLGDVARALENYEKALALDPKNENAKEKLKELRSR